MAKGETFRLRIVTRAGLVLIEHEGSSVAGLMQLADALPHHAADAIIRGEFTSDGTRHGIGRGRVHAMRESKRWIRY